MFKSNKSYVATDSVRSSYGGVRTIENDMYAMYRKSARNKCLTFDIDREFFRSLIQQPCVYCGNFDTKRHRRTFEEFLLNGIDRVDSKVGYVESNCVSCCSACNYSKRTLSKDEFLSLVKKVYERNFA